MIKCIFGWGKQHGTMRKTKHRGIGRVAANFLLNLIAYNLVASPNCFQHSQPGVKLRPQSPHTDGATSRERKKPKV
jgi:hypothetical protein